jgi:site-specific DNA-cytosine methylase
VTNGITVLSLFDGIACGKVALERAGISITSYYASEIDRPSLKISRRQHKRTIEHLGDVNNWRSWGIDWKSIDLIIGGSPCQGFSSAGLGLAFDDPRSALFFTFVEILEHVRTHNPDALFLLENVDMKKEWLDTITEYLGVAPVLVNSARVSAQERSRQYWTNWAFPQPEDAGITLSSILEPGYWTDRQKAHCIDANYGKGSTFNRYFFKRSRQIVFEDGYTIPQMTADTANAVMERDGHPYRILTVGECERLQTLPVGYTAGVADLARYRAVGNGWTVDVLAHIFSHMPLKAQQRPKCGEGLRHLSLIL